MYKDSVCVVGLGYVGLPTACVLANSGYSVFGVDIDENVINNIRSSDYLNSEPGLQDLLNKVNAIDSIIPYIKPGNLIIIESTCPIGTTEGVTSRLRSACADVHVAYCPERILPGHIIYELKHNNRVIGGIDKESTLRAVEFYKTFSSGKISLTDAKTAEAIKLAENTYINIAYANELSIIADILNIDISLLIKLANEHPRVNILEPGIGVGGHCIAVDPHFLIFSAPNESSLITTARKVNDTKSNWIIKKIITIAKQKDIQTIACLGLTYKPNVFDIRNSPAIKIAESLEEKFHVLRIDPYVKNSYLLEEVIDKIEMVITLVAHDQFINISAKLPANIVYLDFTGKCK